MEIGKAIRERGHIGSNPPTTEALPNNAPAHQESQGNDGAKVDAKDDDDFYKWKLLNGLR